MRATHIIAAVLIGIAGVVPTDTRAQVSVSISLGAQLGPPMPVFAYSPARYGPWRADYVHWAPVVLYEMNGRYYRHRARGARALEVYASSGDYFFPPREAAWVGFDRRYDYRRRPEHDDDDGRGRAHGRGRGRGHGGD